MKQSTKLRQERSEEQVLAGEGAACIICAGLMDGTDQKFKPCKCRFKLCVWCFHKIREEAAEANDQAKCPGCRREYNEQILKMKIDLKTSLQKPSRKRLENLLVVQRRVVRLSGLPKKVAKEDTLRSFAYLGQYGTVTNITLQPQTVASCEAHATFLNVDDASKAVSHIDGCSLDGNIVRASHTLHRYCPAFIRNTPCNVKSCPYLHTLAAEEDHVPKGDQHALKTTLSHIAKGVHRKQGFPPVAKPKAQPNAQKAGAAPGDTGAKPSVSLLPANSTWGGTRNMPGQAARAPTPEAEQEAAPAPEAAPAAPAPASAPAHGAKQTKQHSSWASAAAVTVMSVSSGKRTQPKNAASARAVEGGAKKEKEKDRERVCKMVAEQINGLPQEEAVEREVVNKERTVEYRSIIQQWIALMTRKQEEKVETAVRGPLQQQPLYADPQVVPRSRDVQLPRYVREEVSMSILEPEAKEEAEPEVETEPEMEPEEVGCSRLAMWQAAQVQQDITDFKAPAKSQQTSGNGLNPMAQGWTPGQGFVDQQQQQQHQQQQLLQQMMPGWGVDMLHAQSAQMPINFDMMSLGFMQPAVTMPLAHAQQATAFQQGFLLPVVGNGLIQIGADHQAANMQFQNGHLNQNI